MRKGLTSADWSAWQKRSRPKWFSSEVLSFWLLFFGKIFSKFDYKKAYRKKKRQFLHDNFLIFSLSSLFSSTNLFWKNKSQVFVSLKMLEEIVLVQLVDALTFTKWLFNFSRRKKAARCVRKMATPARIYRRFYGKLLISYDSIKLYFLKVWKIILRIIINTIFR